MPPRNMTVDLVKGARETFENLLLFLTKKKEREQATVWLPDDIMFEILVKLSNASLRHCLYVSKQFHNIISDLTFERSRSPIKPALIMHLHPRHGKVPKDHLYLHLANDWYDRASASSVITIERPPLVPDLSKLCLVDACNEMLCFLQQNTDQSIIHIYNSQTNQWMQTPPFEPSQKLNRRVPLCGLYYHQRSHYCYRVFAFVNQNGYLVHDLGTGFWRRVHRYEYFPCLQSWIDGAVLMNGRLHWSTRKEFAFCSHKIMAFDINLETF
ncbi:F-box protein [Rhynchospora pubera]|uniref:F-box protein n=1 Tax=Rhynchospora pubera TaxID=906938 RepID=A0AAV8EDS1_9POAL|nr:F-box protein [Rhynchospora pubera]